MGQRWEHFLGAVHMRIKREFLVRYNDKNGILRELRGVAYFKRKETILEGLIRNGIVQVKRHERLGDEIVEIANIRSTETAGWQIRIMNGMLVFSLDCDCPDLPDSQRYGDYGYAADTNLAVNKIFADRDSGLPFIILPSGQREYLAPYQISANYQVEIWMQNIPAPSNYWNTPSNITISIAQDAWLFNSSLRHWFPVNPQLQKPKHKALNQDLAGWPFLPLLSQADDQKASVHENVRVEVPAMPVSQESACTPVSCSGPETKDGLNSAAIGANVVSMGQDFKTEETRGFSAGEELKQPETRIKNESIKPLSPRAKSANRESNPTTTPLPLKLSQKVTFRPVQLSSVKSLKAVIFDLDGVVVDSEKAHLATFSAALQPFGVRISPGVWKRNYTGIGSLAIMRDVVARNKINADVDKLVEKRAEIYHDYIEKHGLPVMPGFREFFATLQRRGVQAAIASGGHRPHILASMMSIGIPRIPFVGLEDVERRKPAPDVFLLAAKRLGVSPSECIVFEDSLAGLQAAAAAGMPCIALATTLPKKELEGKAALIIANFRSRPLTKTLARLLAGRKGAPRPPPAPPSRSRRSSSLRQTRRAARRRQYARLKA